LRVQGQGVRSKRFHGLRFRVQDQGVRSKRFHGLRFRVQGQGVRSKRFHSCCASSIGFGGKGFKVKRFMV